MNWFRRGGMTDDLSEEMRLHLEEKVEELVADGMEREEAVHAARRAFGNLTRMEERGREVWMWPLVEGVWADLKFAIRQLRKSTGFAVTVILTLALGIGATTAIFSLVNAVLLRPLPFPEQSRLMWLAEALEPNGSVAGGRHPIGNESLSYPDFFDWRAKNHSFAEMASYRDDSFTLTGHGNARELNGAIVSAGFFHVLGVEPVLGRGFLPSEENRGAYTVVLSHGLWQSTFNSERDIVGRDIALGGRSFRVVGVMPKGFVFPIQTPAAELWTTLAVDAADPVSPTTSQRGADMLSVIGRLKPGVTVEQARADLSLIAANLAVQYPASNRRQDAAVVQPELEHLIGNSQTALRVLFGAVMLVLLIACVNVAGLLLARATRRRPEFAMRAALGAGRITILRQMLVESVFLACCGGALGLGLSVAMLRALVHLVPQNLPRMGQISVDGAVLGFALLASLATGLLFGVLPAWRMSRVDPAVALRDGTRTVAGGAGQHRLHDWLVVIETALALVLLAGSGLLIRSFVRVLQVNPGFDAHRVLTANIDLPDDLYSTRQQMQFYRQLLPRLAAQPGVQSVAAGWPLPFSGSKMGLDIDIQGRPTPPGESPDEALSIVTPTYFQTLHIPVMWGRAFRESDDSNAPPVAIVSESFARKYFPGEDAVGKRIEPGIGDGITKKSMREIVGVVGDVKARGLANEVKPQCYLPYAQAAVTAPTLVVRTAVDPAGLVGPLRAQIAAMDGNVPLYDVHTFENMVGQSAAQPRFQMLLLTCFAAMALLLSAIGLYGVLSYMVAQRTLEIGVRIALGAQRSDILRMVLGRGLMLAGAGLGIGLGLSALLTRWLAGMLYGVRTFDPVTFFAVTLVLLAVSLLASSVPARRAASVDPMRALRAE